MGVFKAQGPPLLREMQKVAQKKTGGWRLPQHLSWTLGAFFPLKATPSPQLQPPSYYFLSTHLLLINL